MGLYIKVQPKLKITSHLPYIIETIIMRETFHAVLVLVAVLFFGAVEFCFGGNTSFSCKEGEREALLKFKLCFNDSSHMLSSWKGNDCCEWGGVGCDKKTGHVVSLQLRGSIFQLRGSIFDQPQLYLIDDVEEVVSSLHKLRYLEHLDLSGNNFSGSLIPPSFGLMKQLRYLNLSNAQFRGRIPGELKNLTRLQILDLSQYYYGSLKVDDDIQWISGLSSLQQLDMTGVNLSRSSSNLFQVLDMLSLLSWLSLSDCSLKNSHLPSRNHSLNFTILGNIQHFDISWNSFHGPLPIFLQNMTSLAYLDMSGVNLSLASSDLFQLLGMLPSLSWLHLSSCSLNNSHLPSHSHPLNFTFLGNIQHFDISQNSFQGPIPIFLQNMTSLTFLYLFENQLSGSIPDSIEQLSKLERLDLSENQLSGSIPGSIGQLSKLERLDLSGNQLSRSIPDSIGQLSKLEGLSLSVNQLSGSIPDSIRQLSKLESLSLAVNQLNGSIPDSIGQLSKLEWVTLFMNQLIGSIPDSIGQLSNLEHLDISHNKLNGAIPESIGQLSNLGHLDISYNKLNGAIPDSIGQLSNLGHLDISNNQLNGAIPESISKLSNLEELYVEYNSLEGVISEAHFANLSKLTTLSIGFNNLNCEMISNWRPPSHLDYIYMGSCKFGTGFPKWLQFQKSVIMVDLSNASISGPLPENISHMLPKLGRLYLENNLMNGSIPKSLCNLKTLEYLDLSNNMLSGSIHDCWRNDQILSLINLSSNNLSGLFPSTIRWLSSLLVLQLNNNSLYGELPKTLKNFTSLVVLDLGENKFSGNLTWIGEGKISNYSLKVLRLRNNLFSGYIPLELCSLSKLQILDLANNSLIGRIPCCFGKFPIMVNGTQSIYDLYESYWQWAQLREVVKGRYLDYTKKTLGLQRSIDLSSNNLVGTIPEELIFLKELHNLNLSWNHLSGKIPQSIGQMENLESLDFSQNDLSGIIPNSMSSLTKLSHLNLSYNNFSGPIPKGNQLQTLEDPTIYASNPQLCGAPLLKNCSDDVLPPTSTIDSKDKNEDAHGKMWFYIVVMLGFAIGFWGVVGTLIFMKSWRYAYFQCVDNVKDWILVVITLKVVRFKKMFSGNPNDQ